MSSVLCFYFIDKIWYGFVYYIGKMWSWSLGLCLKENLEEANTDGLDLRQTHFDNKIEDTNNNLYGSINGFT